MTIRRMRAESAESEKDFADFPASSGINTFNETTLHAGNARGGMASRRSPVRHVQVIALNMHTRLSA
ncbi:MAG: hypothetical protein R3B91_21380 [Planctomycetaceae bacterium]